MRILTTPTFLALTALAFAATQAGITPLRAQSAPVQAEQTPQQSDQARAQDRGRAEGVKIGRDWRAHEDQADRAGPAAADADRSHETIGRDWRAHPDNRDH